jgi:hypothetical protein
MVSFTKDMRWYVFFIYLVICDIAMENCHRKFVDLPNMVIFYGDINLPDVPEGNNP